jgi:hypothetical protein
MIDLLFDWKKRRDIRYAAKDVARAVRNRFRYPAVPPRRAGLFADAVADLPSANITFLPAAESFDLDVRILGDPEVGAKFPNAGNVEFSKPFVGELMNGHFMGPNGDVFSDEGTVFTDVNPQYGVRRNQHRLTRIGRIPAAQNAGAGTVAVLGCATPKNLYHWMFESFGRLDLLEAAGVSADRIYMPATSGWQLDLLRNCGFPMDRLVPMVGGHFKAERLIFTSMPGDNSADVYSSVKSFETFRAVSERIRRGFQATFPAEPDLNLYIGRRGGRKILNEDDLKRALFRVGTWQEIYMEDLSFEQKRDLLGRAKRIVGMYGAAFSNMMFFHPQCSILELITPSFVGYDYWAAATALGMRHVYLACEAPGLGALQRRNPNLDAIVPISSLDLVATAFGDV